MTARKQLAEEAKKEAKRRLLLEDLVVAKPFIKTLFSGLKLGHEDNVAVVHPFMYIMRRVFLAMAIVLMANHGTVAVLVL